MVNALVSAAEAIGRVVHMSTAAEPLTFDEFVDQLRIRLGAADALSISEAHDFKTLMADCVERSRPAPRLCVASPSRLQVALAPV
jgi:hypothetical protein